MDAKTKRALELLASEVGFRSGDARAEFDELLGLGDAEAEADDDTGAKGAKASK